MNQIPDYILVQVHRLAAEGMAVNRIAFLTRLDPDVIEEELKNPTVSTELINRRDEDDERPMEQ
jgi:hypothetical protein